MRPRTTLIAAGSFLLGCHSLTNLGDTSHLQSRNVASLDSASINSDKSSTYYAASLPRERGEEISNTLPAHAGSSPNLAEDVAKAPPAHAEGSPNLAMEESPETVKPTHSDSHLQPLLIRLHYAELLISHQRQAEAKVEFERLIGEAEELSPFPLRQLIHSHSKLMELAIADDDDYAEHLHRGIGLYYLASQSYELGQTSGKLNVESLLCQAAGELSLAKLQKPSEARPCFFLYQVWIKLEQPRPARRNLRDAEKTCAFSYMTASERRSLYLASSSNENQPNLKR
jgi:hypothetical protein